MNSAKGKLPLGILLYIHTRLLLYNNVCALEFFFNFTGRIFDYNSSLLARQVADANFRNIYDGEIGKEAN